MVCWWRRSDWSFARLIAPAVTTTCIILSSNKIQNGDVLVPANPGPPGKWKLKWTEREFSVTVTANLYHTALWVRNHVMECWQAIITAAKQCGKHVQRQLVETVSASSLW